MPDRPIGISTLDLVLSLLAWLGVGVFWFATTQHLHASAPLAAVATGSLLVAYAAVSYANHGILIPNLLRRGRPIRYAVHLAISMIAGTLIALAALKTVYVRAIGWDRVNPLWYDVAVDLLGMVIHVAGAAGVVWLWRRWGPARGQGTI